MLNKVKSEYISWIFLIGIIILFLEFTFFNRGLIFSFLVNIGMIYFGKKWMPRTIGKLLFWSGIVFLIISIFNMITIRFFLLAILVHLIIQFAQSKRKPAHMQPEIKAEAGLNFDKEPILRKETLFANQLFGQQKTPEHGYEWRDINIQAGIGDTIIDLSYTVLPRGETVMFIRNVIGNIRILVPYDIEISVNHSVIVGSSEILEFAETKLFNQSVQVQTPGFDHADQRIKIFTSLFIGDLEVKRV